MFSAYIGLEKHVRHEQLVLLPPSSNYCTSRIRKKKFNPFSLEILPKLEQIHGKKPSTKYGATVPLKNDTRKPALGRIWPMGGHSCCPPYVINIINWVTFYEDDRS